MKILTVCFLGFAVVVLVGAAAVQEEKAENDQKENNDLVKRNMRCTRGWTRIYGGCYKYVPFPMTWGRAERNCQSMGAHLASVQNVDEYHAIQKMIARATHDYKEVWLGASNAQHKNLWQWSNGESFTFSHWCRGEPKNSLGRQRCMQMNYSGRKCWDDVGCYARRPSVCAKKRR